MANVAKLNKNIRNFGGSDPEQTASEFWKKATRDVEAKFGLPPEPEWEPIVAANNLLQAAQAANIAAAQALAREVAQQQPDPNAVAQAQQAAQDAQAALVDAQQVPQQQRTHAWRTYSIRREATFALYLIGNALKWWETQKERDIDYFQEWEIARQAFIARFDNDAHKGAIELELQKLKREPDESMIDWNVRVVTKVNQAFAHEAAASRLEKSRLYFRNGLSQKLQQKYNEIYFENRAIPHEDIVQRVHNYDISLRYTDRTLGHQVHTYENDFEVSEIENQCKCIAHQNHKECNMVQDDPNENPRRPVRARQHCTYCGKFGHSQNECFRKQFDDQQTKVRWGRKYENTSDDNRNTQNKTPTYQQAFNPTNTRNKTFVRPQSGNRGNKPQIERDRRQSRLNIHGDFRRPPGGDRRINYWNGERAPFNINFSRERGAPGTAGYSYRFPARGSAGWVPENDRFGSHYQRIQHSYQNPNRSFPLHPGWKPQGNRPRAPPPNQLPRDGMQTGPYRMFVRGKDRGEVVSAGQKVREDNRKHELSPTCVVSQVTDSGKGEMPEEEDEDEEYEDDESYYYEMLPEMMTQNHLN